MCSFPVRGRVFFAFFGAAPFSLSGNAMDRQLVICHGNFSLFPAFNPPFVKGDKMTAEASWVIYQDAQKAWRWKQVTRDGREIGASDQGFKSLADAVANAKLHGYKSTGK